MTTELWTPIALVVFGGLVIGLRKTFSNGMRQIFDGTRLSKSSADTASRIFSISSITFGIVIMLVGVAIGWRLLTQ